MKFYRQPMSEEFVYSSPEKLTRDSYRWVSIGSARPLYQHRSRGEVRRAAKKRH
ncbi:MAG: hypothetical protein KME56_14920 [Candidatus Thiodiazotropha sp. (ex Ctena orbiculata)]|uniref:Uncharacterized protein n=1 Tax=Candidatus Thiodiazotropha taylori TaxID=2792791 RepID=A0A944QTM1_9GAMM|nr:hypothetical protein [Candidatus Thiodiazotropha taylori]MBT2990078.1 hypothetical protein [Candidatus Thiodiazotropha taylori]MBT2997902.1 hypothetical protein [Candidatus Thiodiazotropha taylori]MBT3001690.1 hypothetical protein [Candidatus Thiodiazotropha taylori]MBT3028496.1 hypothetical protein [Candidatus Thiodiazotropha taylori]